MDVLWTGLVSSVMAVGASGLDKVGIMYTAFDGIGEQLFVAHAGPLNAVLLDVGGMLGFPDDQLKFLFTLLASYPLGLIHRHLLPNEFTKHLFSFVTGMWLVQFCFPQQWFSFFFFTCCFYVLLLLMPNRPKAFFWIVLAVNAVSQIYRMYIDYMGWSLDFTGCQMVMTQKVTMLAYQVYDRTSPTADKKQKLRSVEMPNILTYLGFVFFPAGVMAGPAFHIHEYITFTDRTVFDPNKNQAERKPAPIPAGSYWRALMAFLTGFICIGIQVAAGALVTMPKLSSPEFAALPSMTRFGMNMITKFVFRMKYYFAWMVAEGACVIAGLGYNNFEGVKSRATGEDIVLGNDRSESSTPQWNRLTNAFPIQFDTAQNVAQMSTLWNPLTSRWLKHTVYERSNRNQLMVYSVSAFWHGFYPGYYMFFLSASVGQTINGMIKKKIRPYFMEDDGKTAKPTKAIYDILGMVTVSVTVNYWVIAFVEMDMKLSWAAYKSLYFFGHIGMPVVYVLLLLVPTKKRAEKKE